MASIIPTYSTIQQNFINEVTNLLNGQTPLSNSNIRIIVTALSKAVYSEYQSIQQISLQATPATATNEYLDIWGSIKGVTRSAATQATGQISFTGTAGVSIPSGTVLIAENGETYTTDTLVDVGSNVGITAVNSGSEGNQEANVTLSLQTSIAGVNNTLILSNAITNGTDVENDTNYRTRIITEWSTQNTGTTPNDHLDWVLAVPEVTQAWIPNAPLKGNEVVFYVMLDRTNTYGGYPQGTDGVATQETRGSVASGDQLEIANTLYSGQRPYAEVQYVCSPIKTEIDFTITGLSAASSTVQTNIKTAVQNVLHSQGTPLGTDITLATISEAIETASGTTSFTITAPTADIKLSTGELPEIGTFTFGE